VRTRHTENFRRTFEKLLKEANAVDTEDMISDALLNGSAAGLLYRIIRHAKGEAPLDMTAGPRPPGAPQLSNKP
jgi:hypothetical protein